ncbi:hypothetical protein [Lacticaseibacillus suihuaensis]
MITVNNRITIGAAEMYLSNMIANGEIVDLARASALTLVFENGESLSLRPDTVERLQIWQPRLGEAEQAGIIICDGFWIKYSLAPAAIFSSHLNAQGYSEHDGSARIRACGDISAIVVTQEGATQRYWVNWDIRSTDLENNVAQHFAETERTMTVLAMAPKAYPLIDLIQAARRPVNHVAIVEALGDAIAGATAAGRCHLIANVLNEFASFAPLSSPDPKRRLIVRHSVENASDMTRHTWTPVLRIAGDDEDYVGVGLLSYQELAGMTIEVEGPDFWIGFAWLLWEVTFEGVEATERAQHIRDFWVGLAEDAKARYAFDVATAKMRRFLDAYATAHKTDKGLADLISKYWPLTKGRHETYGAGINMLQLTVAEQEPALLAQFMAELGDDYARFAS